MFRAGTSYDRSALGPAQPRLGCPRPRPFGARGLTGVRAMVDRDPPLEGGRSHGPIGPERPSADIGFPSIGEGRVRLIRYHLCVRVLRTHTYRGRKKVFFATKATGFRGRSDRTGGARRLI